MTRPRDLRHLDPEVRKERLKLLASALNAIGLALLIGSLVAPLLDASRHSEVRRAAFGAVAGVVSIIAGYYVLRYMKRREP